MNHPTIISFNFNEYDIIRTHFISNHINYVYVTDADEYPSGWIKRTFTPDKKDPWYRSLYVRYHPFEFTNSEIAIVIDGSLSVTAGIDHLADIFASSRYDIGLLLSHQPELIGRIYRWRGNNRISPDECRRLIDMVSQTVGVDYRGTVAGAVRLYRKSEKTKEYLDKCWKAICNDSEIVRLDEIPATIVLDEIKDISIMPLSTQIIQGGAFIYNGHRSNGLYRLNYDKSKVWVMNKQANPVMIGNEYHRNYNYRTEVMCLTRYFDADGLRHWINWHLGIGFEHIHIFDNESNYDCKNICDEYGNKVSYELIAGNARHYKIFNEYVNSDRCKSEWIMPIDDDEYFELNKDMFKSIDEMLDWYIKKFPFEHMFAIRWKHMFPKIFHSECTGPITEYCTEENPMIATKFQLMGDRGIKTLVHRYGHIYYEETEENPHGGHVPRHSAANGAMLYNGELIKTCSCKRIPADEQEPARLLHFRYKGYLWYKAKEHDIETRNVTLDNMSGRKYTESYKFGKILDRLP